MEVYLADPPEQYLEWLDPVPADISFVSSINVDTAAAHIFVHSADVLRESLLHLRKNLQPASFIWVSWPKKASKVPTDVTEDTIRALALPLGFVDIKVCAVSEVWSGLKVVIRKELR